jgi:hypothetical protein
MTLRSAARLAAKRADMLPPLMFNTLLATHLIR